MANVEGMGTKDEVNDIKHKRNSKKKIKEINIAQKADNLFSSSFLRVIAACFIACGLTLISIFSFFDKETCLLKVTPLSKIIGVLTVLIAVYIIAEIFVLTANIFDMSGHIEMEYNMLIGVGAVIVSGCFLFQGVFDLINIIKKGNEIIAATSQGENKFLLFISSGNGFAVIACILAFISAVSFAAEGMNMIIVANKKVFFFLKLVPPMWGAFSLLHVMSTYPSISSMQNDFLKVIASIFALLFLYYTSRWLCGLDKTQKAGIGVFFRLVFAPLMGVFALPYCIAAVFSVKDTHQNMPYLVFFGLMLFAIILMLQYMAQALYTIEKKDKTNHKTNNKTNNKKEINIE